MFNTQCVAKLVSSNLQKVRAVFCSIRVFFVFIKVQPAIYGKVGVCKYLSGPVEWKIAPTVATTSKAVKRNII